MPDLPQKDWLEPEKDSATIVYDPTHVYTMDDLVWLAIQQSPELNKGTINLEIQQVSKRNQLWHYLPQLSLVYVISNNITRYNMDSPHRDSTYAETVYQVSFGGGLTNPVTNYLSNKAQDELLKVAIMTQREAITSRIFQIASSLLTIDRQEKTINILKNRRQESAANEELLQIRSEDSHNFKQQHLGATDLLEELDLRLMEAEAALRLEKIRLKRMVGLELEQNLKTDATSLYKLLADFKPQEFSWKDCWNRSVTKFMGDQQIRLETANIWVAWAQYLPNFGVSINESPPKGQAQRSDEKTDEFMHISLSIPFLDWGARKRTAESAALRRRQKRLDLIEAERQFNQDWLETDQNHQLALARVERQENSLKVANKRLEGLEVSYENGAADQSALIDQRLRILDADQALLDARQRAAQAKLGWMNLASELGSHYLGNAGFSEAEN